MALMLQQTYVSYITRHLPWLPKQIILPLSAILLVVAAGTVFAFSYGAVVSVEPESSSLSGGVSVVADGSASGGQSIKFDTPGTCTTKPDASNAGASGALVSDGRTVLTTPNEVIENTSFPGGITIQADGVQLRNVQVNGGILISEADGIILNHISAIAVSLSSSSNVTVEYAHVTAFEGDSFHITSDGSSYINNVTIQYSYIDRPGFNPGSESHWDGVQVRGADGVTIFCNNFDVGAWQDPYNVLIYLEPANGGHNHIAIDNNWLSGGNFAVQAGLPNLPMDFSITNNKLLSTDFHFGYCHLGGDFTSEYLAQVIQTGNTLDGAPMLQVCTDSDR